MGLREEILNLDEEIVDRAYKDTVARFLARGEAVDQRQALSNYPPLEQIIVRFHQTNVELDIPEEAMKVLEFGAIVMALAIKAVAEEQAIDPSAEPPEI